MSPLYFRLLLLFCCVLPLFTVKAQQPFQPQPFSAKTALSLVESRFGKDSGMWISEMRGVGGRPQPARWDVIGYNSTAPGLLQKYSIQPGVALDVGPQNNRYPNDVPDGFFSTSSLIVDSLAAFTIAETEARKARMGFNRCDFLLKSREYSRQPVWQLSLFDVNQQMVGVIHVSGTRGTVLRTIWVQKNTISGYPKIVDSMAPNSASANVGEINTDTSQPLVPAANPRVVAPEFSGTQPQQQPAGDLIPPPPVMSGVLTTPEPAIATSPRIVRSSGSIFKNGPTSSQLGAEPRVTPSAEVSTVKPPAVIDNSAPPIPTQKPTTTKRITAPTIPGAR